MRRRARGRGVPYPQAVLGAGDDLRAVRAEGDVGNIGGVSLQLGRAFAGPGVPDPHRVRRRSPSRLAEPSRLSAHDADRTGMPDENLRLARIRSSSAAPGTIETGSASLTSGRTVPDFSSGKASRASSMAVTSSPV